MPDHTPVGADSLVIDMARRFATERLVPGAAAREKAAAIEPEIVAELGELGIFGATTPAQWDGSEIDPVTYALLLEEIAAGDGSVSTMVSVHNSPTCIIFDQYGTDAQKDRWLRPLATGAAVGSFALTEPQAGSDASNLRTRAVRKGDRYVINGAKQFISSGRMPGSTVLFAVTDPAAGRKGISCFVVDKAAPGYVVRDRRRSLGRRRPRPARWRSRTWRCRRTSASAPRAKAIGSRCRRWRAGGSASRRRAWGWRAPRSTARWRTPRSGRRSAGGSSISRRWGSGWSMPRRAGGGTPDDVHAARLKAEGQPAIEAACMAKLFASEAAEAVCTAAIQTLGGYGYLADFPVERMYRDVRVCQIYEGTSDVQKLILQRML